MNVPACWQSNEERGLLSHIGKGPRLIIVHAGGQGEFIDRALIIFKSKSKTGDYRSDMNFANFSKWTREKLLANLPPNSVIVMDNASYHSVQEEKSLRCYLQKQSCRPGYKDTMLNEICL